MCQPEHSHLPHWRCRERERKKIPVVRQDQCHKPPSCCLFHTETTTVSLWIPHKSTVTLSHVHSLCFRFPLIEVNNYSFNDLNNMGPDCDQKRSYFRCIGCHALGLVNNLLKHNHCFFLPWHWDITLLESIPQQQESRINSLLVCYYPWNTMNPGVDHVSYTSLG